MKISILLSTLFLAVQLNSQTVADFENYEIPVDTFLNGSDGSGQFNSGNIILPNNYDPMWDSWSGWAISSKTDTITAGFTNQYSVISGSGYMTDTYATSFVSGESIIKYQDVFYGSPMTGVYVNNATYTYLSMLEGDAFAKKFGGESGDDPDYLLLTIKKYLNGELSSDSINFYLADFRFEDNSEDYIIKDWTYVDLVPLGNVDSLSFTLSSTDNGAFGMNTPAYFCIDDLEDSNLGGSTSNTIKSIKLYPNPSSDFLNLVCEDCKNESMVVVNMQGQTVMNFYMRDKQKRIDVSQLAPGMYYLSTLKNRTRNYLLVKK